MNFHPESAPVSSVTLNNIVKRFGTFTAVHKANLEIPEGAFVKIGRAHV